MSDGEGILDHLVAELAKRHAHGRAGPGGGPQAGRQFEVSADEVRLPAATVSEIFGETVLLFLGPFDLDPLYQCLEWSPLCHTMVREADNRYVRMRHYAYTPYGDTVQLVKTLTDTAAAAH